MRKSCPVRKSYPKRKSCPVRKSCLVRKGYLVRKVIPWEKLSVRKGYMVCSEKRKSYLVIEASKVRTVKEAIMSDGLWRWPATLFFNQSHSQAQCIGWTESVRDGKSWTHFFFAWKGQDSWTKKVMWARDLTKLVVSLRLSENVLPSAAHNHLRRSFHRWHILGWGL